MSADSQMPLSPPSPQTQHLVVFSPPLYRLMDAPSANLATKHFRSLSRSSASLFCRLSYYPL